MDKTVIAGDVISGGMRKILVFELVGEFKINEILDAKYLIHIGEMMLPDGRMVNVPTADPAFCTSSISKINSSKFLTVKVLNPIDDAQFLRQYEAVISSAKAKMSGLVVPPKSGIITE